MADSGLEKDPKKGSVNVVGAVAVTLVSLMLMMGLVEAASRVLLPNLYFVWPPNFSMVFDAESNIGGVDFPSQLTINIQGMRGESLDDEYAYRVLAVGGSTTICVYLDDENAWPWRVQKRLNEALGAHEVWVGNAGRPGHMTTEHVLQVEALLAQYPEIDAVMLLIGINDLIRHLPKARDPNRKEPPYDPNRVLRMAFSFYPGWDDDTPWYKRNIVARVWQMTHWHPWGRGSPKQLRPEDAKGEFVAMMREYRQHAAEYLPELPDLASGLSMYEDRVNQIIDIAQRADVDVVLMTQPVLWRAGLSKADRKLLWGGGPPLGRFRNGATYYSVEALAQGMALYNDKLLEICESRGLQCLDLDAAIPRTTKIFYDDAHFTDHGSDQVSQVVAAHLLQRESLKQKSARAR